MKTQNELKSKGCLVATLTALLLLSAACAKPGSGSSTDQAPPADGGGINSPTTPRDTDGPRGPEFSSGATAALEIDSLAALTAYVATHPVNNPKDIRISVKAFDTGNNQYAGDVYISYQDNGQYYTGHFITRNAQNPTGSVAQSGTLYPGWKHSAYNNWFMWNNRPAFHGFFQDSYGAIMLIVDQSEDQGDGSGATMVSGSIWFKNYANSQTQKNWQQIPCWFITAAAYDCRTLLVAGGLTGDGNIVSNSGLYPTDSKWFTSRSTHPYTPEEPARGWRRLGRFSGLNKTKAFSQ